MGISARHLAERVWNGLTKEEKIAFHEGRLGSPNFATRTYITATFGERFATRGPNTAWSHLYRLAEEWYKDGGAD